MEKKKKKEGDMVKGECALLHRHSQGENDDDDDDDADVATADDDEHGDDGDDENNDNADDECDAWGTEVPATQRQWCSEG